MPRVLNKYKDTIPPNAVSIMRPGPFGNPYVMGRDGDRQQVIAKYKEYLKGRIKDPSFRARLHDLVDKDLICCCAPLPCHGHVLIKVVEKLKSKDS